MIKLILIFFGTISLCLGVIGIFIPGLPTTVFLLLTAGLYIRSSDRLYQFVMQNRILGPYIREYQSNRGMTLKSKLVSISLMWTMISISAFILLDPGLLRLFLVGAGLLGTIVMGLVVPTIKNNSFKYKS